MWEKKKTEHHHQPVQLLDELFGVLHSFVVDCNHLESDGDGFVHVLE
jgi:hypothetical protein